VNPASATANAELRTVLDGQIVDIQAFFGAAVAGA
jgi:hypothetical protein